MKFSVKFFGGWKSKRKESKFIKISSVFVCLEGKISHIKKKENLLREILGRAIKEIKAAQESGKKSERERLGYVSVWQLIQWINEHF